MKILQVGADSLTNQEVFKLVQEEFSAAQARQESFSGGHAAAAGSQSDLRILERQIGSARSVTEYLERCYPVAARLGEVDIKKFLHSIAGFSLTNDEILQILNLTPSDAVFFYGICQHCEKRFTEDEVEQLCVLVKRHLLGMPMALSANVSSKLMMEEPAIKSEQDNGFKAVPLQDADFKAAQANTVELSAVARSASSSMKLKDDGENDVRQEQEALAAAAINGTPSRSQLAPDKISSQNTTDASSALPKAVNKPNPGVQQEGPAKGAPKRKTAAKKRSADVVDGSKKKTRAKSKAEGTGQGSVLQKQNRPADADVGRSMENSSPAGSSPSGVDTTLPPVVGQDQDDAEKLTTTAEGSEPPPTSAEATPSATPVSKPSPPPAAPSATPARGRAKKRQRAVVDSDEE